MSELKVNKLLLMTNELTESQKLAYDNASMVLAEVGLRRPLTRARSFSE